MAQSSNLSFPVRNVIFRADNSLYEELNPDVSASLGAFKTSNPHDGRFQRPNIHVSSTKSKFKKTVELILCVHGWENPDKKEPMTLIVLGVNLSCHDLNSRFQSVTIKLKFDEDDTSHPANTAKANPQVVAYAPFVQQKRWNHTTATVTENRESGGDLGVDKYVQAKVSANNSSEFSYVREYFDRGSAHPIYDKQTRRLRGVEWYCEQNEQQEYGVMPNFHLAVLLKRSHDEDRAIPFKAKFEMRTEAGSRYDFEQGLRRVFRGLKPEDDPVYFDPSRDPDVNGVAGVGQRLFESIQIDNLGALAEGQFLSKLVDSAGGFVGWP
ncbi:hypothetical protein TrVGV298_001321 [Trichoderma virens]|nr:hypothetical protein TrVGV298_001321 [Trichoderma virens]